MRRLRLFFRGTEIEIYHKSLEPDERFLNHCVTPQTIVQSGHTIKSRENEQRQSIV